MPFAFGFWESDGSISDARGMAPGGALNDDVGVVVRGLDNVEVRVDGTVAVFADFTVSAGVVDDDDCADLLGTCVFSSSSDSESDTSGSVVAAAAAADDDDALRYLARSSLKKVSTSFSYFLIC